MLRVHEIELAQAIIDGASEKVDDLLADAFVRQWINNQVSVTALFNHGLDRSIRWTTPMCRAAGLASLDTVQQLVREGATVNNVNSRGDTALIRACLGRSKDVLEMVQFLVQHDKTLVKATDDRNFTALHCAAETGRVEVCEYLIEKGAVVKARNDDDACPLHFAAGADHVDVVECLLKRGADLGTRTRNDSTPLNNAALHDARKVVVFLLSNGIDINKRGFQDRTALHNVAQNGHIDLMHELIERGAMVDAKDQTDITPLYLAALSGNAEIVTELINKYGVDMNVQTREGRTPLHAAAYAGYLNAVKVLTSHATCKVNTTDKQGKTALDLAIDSGHDNVTNFLSQIMTKKEIVGEIGVLREAFKQGLTMASGRGAEGVSATDDTKHSAIDLKRAVQREMVYLKENINPADHILFLFTKEILTQDELQTLQKIPSDGKKVEQLVLMLLSKPNPSSWAPHFLQSLRAKSPHAADQILATASTIALGK